MFQLFNIYYTLFTSDGREKPHTEYATSRVLGHLHFNSRLRMKDLVRNGLAIKLRKWLVYMTDKRVSNSDIYVRRTCKAHINIEQLP